MSKSHDSLLLPRNQSTQKTTTMSKALRLPRTLLIDIKPLQSPPPVTQKPTLDHQKTRFRLRLSQKVITKPENAHGTTTRVHSRRAPAPAHQILRACAVEMHFEDLKVNECTVNSSELAANGCEHLDQAPVLNRHIP